MLSFIFALAVCLCCVSVVAKSGSYEVWCMGNCDQDKVTQTMPGVVLMGGGTDTDEAFNWQIKNANGGDFVVIRTSGDDAYNPWINDLANAEGAPLNSIRTILFKTNQASSDPEVLTMLRNAEAIFLAGGDQSEYLSMWGNTEVQSILQEKLQTITIGGTSAGCAVLGNWVYTGENGSATSSVALNNPYDRTMTISGAFLKIPYLSNFITDTHFVTRDRMGRLLTFMARIQNDDIGPVSANNNVTIHGVGIDEHTALLLDIHSGDCVAVGVGTAYICSANHIPEKCQAKTPLTFSGLKCHRVNAATQDKFSLSSLLGDGVDYANDIVSGVLQQPAYGPQVSKNFLRAN